VVTPLVEICMLLGVIFVVFMLIVMEEEFLFVL